MAGTDTAIALNRFGLGARPDNVAPADARAWLAGQIDRYQPNPAALSPLAGSPQIMQAYADYLRDQPAIQAALARAANAQPGAAPPSSAMQPPVSAADAVAERQLARRDFNLDARDRYNDAIDARALAALNTPTPFTERLVWFWSNHFALSTEKAPVTALAGAFEAEAIRPHVTGTFEDMLLAVERHPAMTIYLDQIRSVGPNSFQAVRAAARNPQRKPGLNENLAREIMELHTLGVRTGYSQADVTEFARALTGWGIGGQAGGGKPLESGGFVFRPLVHEPGARTIMGKTYNQHGEDQAAAVLHYLATSPATARHIATKLTRHFVADDPPPAVVDRLTAAFQRSGGDLPTVYRALIASPEAWSPTPAKFKTPWEWTISSLRGLGRNDLGQMQIAATQNQLGQPVWRPGSPAGYDDIAASWAAPDALVRRVELAQRFAAQTGDRLDARVIGDKLLPGGALTAPTRTEISRAESPPAALALLLVSPDFQRR